MSSEDFIAEYEKVQKALRIAFRSGGIDGAHHKMRVIDQMVRALTGTEEKYKEWVEEYEEDGYEWDVGIAC